MCGIAGLVGGSAETALPRVREALTRLAHRGPDGEGIHTSARAVIAMRRLSIIDLRCGDQPIYNEDRSVAVVCNGELYNYVEQFPVLQARGHKLQSASDINLIPHFYEELGERAFEKCRGMFAAAVWDENKNRLTLARDRAGKKPLFYSCFNGCIAFASEIPALIALLDSVPTISNRSIGDYLSLGFIPHPLSIYDGVFALPPAHTLTFSPGGSPVVAPYWSVPENGTAVFEGSRDGALEVLDSAIRESVALRLRSDVPVGLFLSGGIDSGLVASYAAELGARDLLCFVVEVADAELNEAPAARSVANRLGLPIETIPLDVAPLDAVQRVPSLYGQPFADSSAIPSYFVARAAAAHRKVVLNGDGGDEIFAGYRRYWMGKLASCVDLIPRSAAAPFHGAGRFLAKRGARRSSSGFAARALRGVGMRDWDRYLIWTSDLLTHSDLHRLFPELADEMHRVTSLDDLRGYSVSTGSVTDFQKSDFRTILADDLLSKMDIATMANSLEARSPFLDIPLAEFSWSLPEKWRSNLWETKPLLRALARKRLPPSIAAAPKRGFEVPVGRWLATDLKPLVRDLLLAPDSRVGAMGDRTRIRDLVTGKMDFAGNKSQTVWALLVLELFLRAPTPSLA